MTRCNEYTLHDHLFAKHKGLPGAEALDLVCKDCCAMFGSYNERLQPRRKTHGEIHGCPNGCPARTARRDTMLTHLVKQHFDDDNAAAVAFLEKSWPRKRRARTNSHAD